MDRRTDGSSSEVCENHGDGSRYRTGIILVVVGALLLVNQLTEGNWFGQIFMLALGLTFLILAISTRSIGMLIPGGIISGIGSGILLVSGPLEHMSEDFGGGIFLLCMASGFTFVTILSGILTSERHWWPLIPASILGVIGGTLLMGDAASQILTFLNKTWPVGMIVFGLYLLLWQKDIRNNVRRDKNEKNN